MTGTQGAVETALRRFEGRYPKVIDLSLGRVLALLDTLGRPQDRLPPVIHVAGTNGKGSTCAFLRAMAEAAGLRVHVAISPHLVRFNERIRLAGRLVEDGPLIAWLDRVDQAVGTSEITHFEAAMAASFLAFSEVPADLLVLEVGLGGRFDATNVIDAPAVSVITPVDYDHKQFLGTDISRIAWEKAGIIKPGRQVVSAMQGDVQSGVIAEEAFARGAPLTVLTPADMAALPPQLSLPGDHQRANAALAAKALAVWADPRITPQAVQQGCASAVWPARLQRLGQGPLTVMAGAAELWLDGGHNPHAARAVAAHLAGLPGRTVLVTAMMAGKDAAGFFAALSGVATEVHTCPNADGHAGADPAGLAALAGAAGLRSSAHGHFAAALAAAARSRPDRILICGSLYLSGEVLALNGEAPE